MRERRLLERIAAYEVEGERSLMTRADVLVGSIVKHLSRILNTRQGSVPIDPEFGVPDFTNLASTFSTGSMEQIAIDITRMVKRYEPRLISPKVETLTNLNDILSLKFAIKGDIAIDLGTASSEQRTVPVQLTTQVSSDGRVTTRAG